MADDKLSFRKFRSGVSRFGTMIFVLYLIHSVPEKK
jgi:hypothetical protein